MADRSSSNPHDAELVGRLLRLIDEHRQECAQEGTEPPVESAIVEEIQAISEEIAADPASAPAKPGASKIDEVRTLEQELFQRQQELAERLAKTRLQRRSIAMELRRRRNEIVAEIEARQAEVDAQADQLRLLRKQLDERAEAIDRREQDLSEREDALDGGGVAAPSGDGDGAEAGGQHDEQLVEEMRQLQKRFELAIADVRELKDRNAELEEQLAKRRPSEPASTGEAASAGFDWESQKRRMMASLEDDFDDDDDQQQRDDRLTVEGAIRITDDVIAQKDAEIAELTQRLQELRRERSSPPADESPAKPSDAEVAAVLDHDEVIAQERQRLATLQEEWREKLRQAEVELSLERAKLSRERAQLDEAVQAFESEKAKYDFADDENTPSGKGKGVRRHWWSRLGLKDEE